jgi:hypothetical protein
MPGSGWRREFRNNELHRITNEPGGLKMNVELTEEQKIKILNSSDVYMVMKQILMRENKIERDFEHVYIVCLACRSPLIDPVRNHVKNG